MNSLEKSLKNSGLYFIALVIQRALSFVLFSFFAIYLGSTNLGIYSYILSITTVFSILADLGITTVIIRDLAKDPDNIQTIFSKAFFIKILSGLLSLIIGLGVITLTENNLAAIILPSALALLSMFFDSLSLFFFGIFRAKHQLNYESKWVIIFQVCYTLIGGLVAWVTKNLTLVFLVLTITSFFQASFVLLHLKKTWKIKLQLRWGYLNFLSLVVAAWPFALAGIFNKVYGYIDTIVLHHLQTSQIVGYYSLAYKATFSLQFIPMALVAGFFPLFSADWQSNKPRLAKAWEANVIYLFVLGTIISLITLIYGQLLISLIYGQEYLAAIPALKILICSLPFVFITFPLGSLLNACNQQKSNTATSGLAMLLAIILNLILIPKYSLVGAAWANFSSTFFLLLGQFYFAQKILKDFNFPQLYWNFIKIISISIIAVATSVYFLTNILAQGVLVAIIFFPGLYIAKSIKLEQLNLLKSTLWSK